MEENKVVEELEKAGMAVIDLPPIPEAKPMNGLIVAGAAGAGLGVGVLLMWVGPKIVRGIAGAFGKGKKAKAKANTIEAEDLIDDED